MVSTVLLDVQFRQGDVMGSPQTHSTQREVAELPSLSSSSSYISAMFSCSTSSSGAEESCQTFLPFAVRVDYSAGMATCSKLCMLLQAEIGGGSCHTELVCQSAVQSFHGEWCTVLKWARIVDSRLGMSQHKASGADLVLPCLGFYSCRRTTTLLH